jgi:hypothetical protein
VQPNLSQHPAAFQQALQTHQSECSESDPRLEPEFFLSRDPELRRVTGLLSCSTTTFASLIFLERAGFFGGFGFGGLRMAFTSASGGGSMLLEAHHAATSSYEENFFTKSSSLILRRLEKKSHLTLTLHL